MLSSRTRGDTTELHGPLQRWLEDAIKDLCAHACLELQTKTTFPSSIRSLISLCNVPTESLSAWRLLTVKLRGRAEASAWRRGRTLSSSARGDTTEHHGPLQRLLEVTVLGGTVRVRPSWRKPKAT